MKTIRKLVDVEPSWPTIVRLLEDARRNVEIAILDADQARGEDSLYRIQVSVRSPLGSIAYYSGGVLIDGGWLRLLGCGSSDGLLPSIADFNSLPAEPEESNIPDMITVAYDILGGLFSIVVSDVLLSKSDATWGGSAILRQIPWLGKPWSFNTANG